jgi:enoyl-CoA hydratase
VGTDLRASGDSEVLVEVRGGVATVTLNRPEARNALSSALLVTFGERMRNLGADDEVDVVIVTGADPAFCAGLDLKELGSSGANLSAGTSGDPATTHNRRFWPEIDKPVIGAVNGPAMTGGLELALQCDFLVASERARFADTHARVGVVPGGGMSTLLPARIGYAKAVQMSLSARPLDADEALAWGLVTHVVQHEELLDFTFRLAREIVATDPVARRTILDLYRRNAMTTTGDAWDNETSGFIAFRRSFDPATVRDPRTPRPG